MKPWGYLTLAVDTHISKWHRNTVANPIGTKNQKINVMSSHKLTQKCLNWQPEGHTRSSNLLETISLRTYAPDTRWRKLYKSSCTKIKHLARLSCFLAQVFRVQVSCLKQNAALFRTSLTRTCMNLHHIWCKELAQFLAQVFWSGVLILITWLFSVLWHYFVKRLIIYVISLM